MPITKIIFLAQGPLELASNGNLEKYSAKLSRIKSAISDVEGFILASAQWRPKGKFLVHRSEAPPLLGENAPTFSVKGEPNLAALISKAAEATGLWAETTEEWGLDPGHWNPLIMVSGDTQRVVIPLSISQMSPEAHRKWGVAIRRGTQKWPGSLALVISGSLSHRLDVVNESDMQRICKFDDEVVRMLSQGAIGQLDEMDKSLFKAAQPEGGWGSLYTLWGALGENVPGELQHYDRPLPGVGSASFLFHV